jgi:hypothetical protein
MFQLSILLKNIWFFVEIEKAKMEKDEDFG